MQEKDQNIERIKKTGVFAWSSSGCFDYLQYLKAGGNEYRLTSGAGTKVAMREERKQIFLKMKKGIEKRIRKGEIAKVGRDTIHG